jgi:hypothetical protein
MSLPVDKGVLSLSLWFDPAIFSSSISSELSLSGIQLSSIVSAVTDGGGEAFGIEGIEGLLIDGGFGIEGLLLSIWEKKLDPSLLLRLAPQNLQFDAVIGSSLLQSGHFLKLFMAAHISKKLSYRLLRYDFCESLPVLSIVNNHNKRTFF